MIEDPSYDLHWQLTWVRRQVEHLSAGRELGVPVANHLGLHLLHFGTGPLTTAFGARIHPPWPEQPFYEPAVHTPREAMNLRKPDLRQAGVLPDILERIAF